ncbi:MAG TPA: group 1 glycosyl transferase [Cyanobacteria bacterium UBA8803]|nr:group 1 glycosyl transferase [Cyanobacteria bacterium UBA9273]HBL61992.1 group 1 glycosyl transferase [Cyanobacteria bacterium UBA8803]
MKHINIITVDNNSGLSKDAAIVASVLRNAGFRVTVYPVGKPTLGHKLQRLGTCLHRAASYACTARPPYAINLFIENIIPSWFSYARINCLIPNQEWFREESRPYLTEIDYILCKTKFAQDIFEKLGCITEFISFTSTDRFQENHAKNYDAFFHMASSLQKGSNTLIDIWQRHPEWPCLTIKQTRKGIVQVAAPNIEYITNYLDDEALGQYQNYYGIHLCPSEAEGFGHNIGEAMSCQAVALTTNAPPMNELIAPNRGILADYGKTKVQRLGINYYVDPQDLEQKVNQVLGMAYAEKKQLGENARDWYQQNDQFFRRRLVEVIRDI